MSFAHTPYDGSRQPFTIGIGPSSSHTVGPMRAARRFAALASAGRMPERVRCTLHGSLALTGKGHATDTAVLLGLAGWEPETIDPDEAPAIVARIRESGRLPLDGGAEMAFDEEECRALDVLADSGLVPPLRMVTPMNGPDIESA